MDNRAEETKPSEDKPTLAKKYQVRLLKRHVELSMLQLVAFGLLFGAIGGYAIYKGLAASPTTPAGSASQNQSSPADLGHSSDDLLLRFKPGTSTKLQQAILNRYGVSVNVSASDNVGVTKVELRADGSLLATATISPYSFFWDSTTAANGSHSLTATTYDAAGNTSSASVTVSVSNQSDTIAPTVTISSPANGSTIGSKVTINASATDNVGVVSMEVYVDGVLKGSSTSGSVSVSWSSRKATSGSHTILVKAYDAAGNIGQSSVTVTK
jgi:hypothetical protein